MYMEYEQVAGLVICFATVGGMVLASAGTGSSTRWSLLGRDAR